MLSDILEYLDQNRCSRGSRVFLNISITHLRNWMLQDGIGMLILNGQVALTSLRWFEQTHSPWAAHWTTMRSLTDFCQIEFICCDQQKMSNFTRYQINTIFSESKYIFSTFCVDHIYRRPRTLVCRKRIPRTCQVLTWIIKSPVFAWKINQNVRCLGIIHATLIDKCVSDAPSATIIDSWFKKSLLGIFLARNSCHRVIFRVTKTIRITIMSYNRKLYIIYIITIKLKIMNFFLGTIRILLLIY